jgi:hypothetical protein
LIAVALALAGCATVQNYQPPEGLTSESAATVTGSKVEISAAKRDLRTYLVRVDGMPTGGGGGRESWERQVLIPEGEHDLMISVTGGDSLFVTSRSGSVTMRASLQAGKRYVARSAVRREGFYAARAVAWIEEDGGGPVTEERPFEIIFHPASPVFIPIR